MTMSEDNAGVVLVPRDPTEEMLDAMMTAYCTSDGSYRESYRAMISAAPSTSRVTMDREAIMEAVRAVEPITDRWPLEEIADAIIALLPPAPVLTGGEGKGSFSLRENTQPGAEGAVVDHMVSRFLAWRLPENFAPDNGISFKATFNDHMNPPMRCNPTGTNLLDRTQAETMVRHMLEGLPK